MQSILGAINSDLFACFPERENKMLDKIPKIDIITIELHTSLIKSGGGNGPMKPGNLLIQGAKSGGKREMRIRYSTRRMPRCVHFLLFEMICVL